MLNPARACCCTGSSTPCDACSWPPAPVPPNRTYKIKLDAGEMAWHIEGTAGYVITGDIVFSCGTSGTECESATYQPYERTYQGSDKITVSPWVSSEQLLGSFIIATPFDQRCRGGPSICEFDLPNSGRYLTGITKQIQRPNGTPSGVLQWTVAGIGSTEISATFNSGTTVTGGLASIAAWYTPSVRTQSGGTPPCGAGTSFSHACGTPPCNCVSRLRVLFRFPTRVEPGDNCSDPSATWGSPYEYDSYEEAEAIYYGCHDYDQGSSTVYEVRKFTLDRWRSTAPTSWTAGLPFGPWDSGTTNSTVLGPCDATAYPGNGGTIYFSAAPIVSITDNFPAPCVTLSFTNWYSAAYAGPIPTVIEVERI